MGTLAPDYDADDVATHAPRPIAIVMAEVLARYGLRDSPQLSDSVAAHWPNHSTRPDCELAVA